MTTAVRPAIEITFDHRRGNWRLLLFLEDKYALDDLDDLTGEAFERTLGLCQAALGCDLRAEGEQA